jgi:hypothetical protein
VALPVLYLLLPQIVAIGHGYLRGSGYVPSEMEQRFFDDHWKVIGLTALFAFGAAEVQGLRWSEDCRSPRRSRQAGGCAAR